MCYKTLTNYCYVFRLKKNHLAYALNFFLYDSRFKNILRVLPSYVRVAEKFGSALDLDLVNCRSIEILQDEQVSKMMTYTNFILGNFCNPYNK